MPSPSKPAPRPYQTAGTEWLTKVRRGLLADEMGLGKSRQLVEASVGRTLVVAPAMVLSGGTWDDEIAKWGDDPDRFVQVPYTGLSEYIASGKGRAPAKTVKQDLRGPWDTVILDEAHYVKSRKATRTDLVMQLAKNTERLFAATGTPIPNWAYEMFTLLQLVYPHKAAPGRELGSYWRWVGRWFQMAPTKYSDFTIGGLRACTPECEERPPFDPCEHYAQFVEANLTGRFLQRRRDDVLTDLPPLTEVEVETPMGPAQARAYRAMKKDFVALVDQTTVLAWSSSARHVKLDRTTTALDLMDPEVPKPKGAKWVKVDNAKLVRLEADLLGRSRPTIVMAHYTDTVEACAQVAKGLGLRTEVIHGKVAKGTRTRRVRAFQAGEVDVLVGSLETLAEGLTLTQADMLIFVEKSYKPSRNQQAMRRIHRLGQDRPCTILDYVTPNSVDQNKRRLLGLKTDQQMRVLTAAQFAQML